jgi:hypothetical protein
MNIGVQAKNITEISAFYVALTGMILGSQLFLAGFISEMVSRNSPQRTEYRISEKIN